VWSGIKTTCHLLRFFNKRDTNTNNKFKFIHDPTNNLSSLSSLSRLRH
jgi:hypothetical protein